MNPSTVTLVGSILVLTGVLATALVAYVGKRGELSLTGLNSLTDQLQEERSDLKQELAARKEELHEQTAALAEKDAALASEAAARATAEAENTRLRAIIIRLGGDPE